MEANANSARYVPREDRCEDVFVARFRDDGTHQDLSDHLCNVADLAGDFADKVGLRTTAHLVGLLHDLGKYSHLFQSYIRNKVADGGDHSSAGAQFVWRKRTDGQVASVLAMQMATLCIASHHSGLMNCLAPDGIDVFQQRINKDDTLTHIGEVQPKIEKSILDTANRLLESKTMLDEIAMRMKASKAAHGEGGLVAHLKLGLLVRFVFSALIDADRLDAAGRGGRGKIEWLPLVRKLEDYLMTFPQQAGIDKLRAAISADCAGFAVREKGVFRLSVPTGGGKTLASLRFALRHAERHGMDRIVYVIPYTSIIDQNANVARSILGNNANGTSECVVLEHHSNLAPEKDTNMARLLAENWDAPVIFTTTVQFLETLFASGTRGARRMHRLANAVIIFDEAQTIPHKVIHLFNNAVNFLAEQCGSTVILCTATQPLLDEVDVRKGALRFSPGAEMTKERDGAFAASRCVEVHDSRKIGGWQDGEIADRIKEELSLYRSVLFIANTKDSARRIFNSCQRTIVDGVFHLSTSMCAAHRMAILETVRHRLNPADPRPVVCISTQLIEAGVDVDFGCVIRAMAGIDSIAQAAGRCNRHGLRETGGRVSIVNPAHENLDHLPIIRIAKEIGERVLAEHPNAPLSPDAMRQYYRYFFFDRAAEMDYPVSASTLGRDDTLLSLLSDNGLSLQAYQQAHPREPLPYPLRQSFMSAGKAFQVIDAPTEGVIVPYGEGKDIIGRLCGAYLPAEGHDLLKAAQRYAVNVFPHLLRRLADGNCVHEVQEDSGIYYLDERFYSLEVGLTLEEISGLAFMNV